MNNKENQEQDGSSSGGGKTSPRVEKPAEMEKTPEVEMRRSERSTKGVPPQRYGGESIVSRKLAIEQKEQSSDKVSRKSDNGSIRSRGFTISNTSTIIRRQVEIDLQKAEQLARIENAEAERDRETARQQAEREKALVELRARLEEVRLAEEADCERQTRASDRSDVRSIISGQLKISERPNEGQVENWLKNTKREFGVTRNDVGKCELENSRGPKYSVGFPIPWQGMSNENATKVEVKTPFNAFKRDTFNGNENPNVPNKYMARQTLGRDLPEFNGNIANWVLFISMFRQTTEACGFTPAENMLRLQKCLKGDALEAVRALLTTINVEKVIDILERRFGRPDCIIEDLMSKVSTQPNVKEDKPATLIAFSNAVTNLVATVESLNRPSYLMNPILLRQLIGKLPPNVRMRWGKHIAYREDTVSLNEFANWMESEAAAASAIYQPTVDERKDKRVLSLQEKDNEEKVHCIFCDKLHKTEMCTGYQKLSVDARWELVKQKRACFGCLSTKHGFRKCSRRACGKGGCRMKHHPSLHNDKRKAFDVKTEVSVSKPDIEKSSDGTKNGTSAEQLLSTQKQKKRVLLQVLPVTLKGPAGKLDTYAILDGGSTITLIAEEVANKLGLKGPVEPLIATWYNDASAEENLSRQVSVEISGSPGKTYLLHKIQTTNMLKLPNQSMKIDPEKWPHLKHLDIPDLENATPTIMIGEDNVHLKKIKRQVTGRDGLPYASLTPLGWMVHGPYDVGRVDREFTLIIRESPKETELHELLRDLWSTESFGVRPASKSLRSAQDQRACDILERTVRRVGERWEAGLLWKEENDVLPESRKAAEKRLVSIERKMSRDPVFGEKYSANMQAYLNKKYAQRLTEEEAAKNGDRVWYLPHFAAFNPQKPGKLRMVFDAAAKSHGESLNDHLLKGPDLLNSLPGLLFKFREGKIAIVGDLREMFHQVQIKEEDRSSQRFLWRNRETNKVDTLEMGVMMF